MTIYINLDDGRASTSSSEFIAPTLFATQGSPLTVDLRFHDGGTVRALAVADLPYLVLQLASANGGTTPRVIGGAGTLTGSGTSSTYRCALVCDNAQMRADFASSNAPLIYDLQVVWREPLDQEKRRTQGVVVNVDVARDLPNTNTPNPVSELDDPDQYIGNRAVLYSESQSLTSEEQEQALTNLGLLNSLSYNPGVIVVSPSQVPGYKTEATLQNALDVLAANPTLYNIIDIRGASLAGTFTAPACSIGTLSFLGYGSIGTLDLTAVIGDTIRLGCDVSTLKLNGLLDITLRAVSSVAVGNLEHRGGNRADSAGEGATNYLTLSGPVLVTNADLSGVDGIAAAADSTLSGALGNTITLANGAIVDAANLSGGDGEDGTLASPNAGNGAKPGNYTLGANTALQIIVGGNLGGSPGTPYGLGDAGYDATGNTSSGTVSGGAFFDQL